MAFLQHILFTVEVSVYHNVVCCVAYLQRILFTTNTSEEELLLRELDVSMRSAKCPFVVQFFGAFFTEVN